MHCICWPSKTLQEVPRYATCIENHCTKSFVHGGVEEGKNADLQIPVHREHRVAIPSTVRETLGWQRDAFRVLPGMWIEQEEHKMEGKPWYRRIIPGASI